MKNYINKIHYSKVLNSPQNIVKTILTVCSPFYSFINSFRVSLYNLNVLKSYKLNAYVIAVGNLTTGGTGKTPLTIELANYLKNKLNKNVAVLSRGYGGNLSSQNTNVISDGNKINFASDDSGDEPYLIALKTHFTPVITGKNRVSSGEYAINNFSSNVLILDDGFQHIKLKRDLNLLVIDADKKFGNAQLLPGGPLRESTKAINRADKIILVNKNTYNKNNVDEISEFAEDLRLKFNKEVYICNFKYGSIYNIKTNQLLSNNVKNIYSFTGIAHPEPFFRYLTEQGYNLTGKNEFIDHHLYSTEDILKVIEQAKNNGAESIITTEKDYVKLIDIVKDLNLDIKIFALKLELELDLDHLLKSLN